MFDKIFFFIKILKCHNDKETWLAEYTSIANTDGYVPFISGISIAHAHGYVPVVVIAMSFCIHDLLPDL